jgi:hypothetical protein
MDVCALPASQHSPLGQKAQPRLLSRVIHGIGHPLVALTAFVLGGLVIYAPALHGELIWDDEYLVGQNPFYKSPIFILEAFRHYLFFDSFSTYYRPVQNLSYIWITGSGMEIRLVIT